MAIAPLPDPPSRGDSTNFAAKADALLSALPAFVTEANALQEDVSAKQEAASNAAAGATEAAGISATKAEQASDSEAAAFSYKGAAEQAASDANLSKIAAAGSATAAATSAASVDAQGFATDYAGPTEPPIKWALMTWADTGSTPKMLRRRNESNSAWVAEGELLSYKANRNGEVTQTFKAAPSAAPDDVVVQSQVFGVGQTWRDVIAGRSAGVSYLNTTGKAIQVAIVVSSNVSATATMYVDSVVVSNPRLVASDGRVAVLTTVPPGGSYQLALSSGTIQTWSELR